MFNNKPEPDPDPKLNVKSEPNPDPKNILMDPQQWRKAELCILAHQDRDEPNSEGRGLNMKKGRRKRRKCARKINNKRKNRKPG